VDFDSHDIALSTTIHYSCRLRVGCRELGRCISFGNYHVKLVIFTECGWWHKYE